MGGKRQTNKEVIAGRSVPVSLGEELYGSLRQLKAQGSVLLDKVDVCVCVCVSVRVLLFPCGIDFLPCTHTHTLPPPPSP